MQFLLLVYIDEALIRALPPGEADAMMRECLDHADELRRDGVLLDAQQLEPAPMAKTVRLRQNRSSIVDGPYAETKEILGGFNLIVADSVEDAVRIAQTFPWIRIGSIEVRPVRDIDAVRMRVGATSAA